MSGGSHRVSLRQIRKACAQEGHHWAEWDRWTEYCWQCSLRRPKKATA